MDIHLPYTKYRMNFGRQPMFCEQGPEMCDSITHNPVETKHYILRNPVHQFTQNSPPFWENYINTIRAEYVSSGVDHSEGGWPKDVNCWDPEVTQRYRRKIEKEDGYYHCVMSLQSKMDHYIKQNNVIDMYRIYYDEMPTLPPVEKNFVRTVNIYRDPHERPITAISWQPEKGRKFAVAYLELDVYNVPGRVRDCFIWDVENSNSRDMLLKPPCGMLDLQYSPRDPELLAGGLLNGQVAQFDTRAGPRPVQLCPPHVAHRDMVRALLFISTKSGTEFFSSGPDGCCKWWDFRNMSVPTDEVIMQPVESNTEHQSMALANGVSCLEYEPTIPARYMVGTENGLVLGGNKKGKTATERIPLSVHYGPVWTVERNPGFAKNFLTVGDWSAKIWSEDCRESPILWSPMLRQKTTCGRWSPTRLSLMVLGSADGKIALWDLLRRQHEPILTVQISPYPVQRMRFHDAGTLLNVGNSKGQITMFEMSNSLMTSDKYDKALLTSVLERETHREHILESRLREIKLKMRQEQDTEQEPDIDVEQAGDHDLNEATTDYFQTVKKELTFF